MQSLRHLKMLEPEKKFQASKLASGWLWPLLLALYVYLWLVSGSSRGKDSALATIPISSLRALKVDLWAAASASDIENVLSASPSWPEVASTNLVTYLVSSGRALTEPQVWSLSSFKVSRQLLINDLNQVLYFSLLTTAWTALAKEDFFELTHSILL